MSKLPGVHDKDELLARIKAVDPNFELPPNVKRLKPEINLPFHALTLTELKQMTPLPIEYIIHPIMPTQGICFIYAAAGVGKTFFTLNIAYAIASGGKFLNYNCPKPRKVLYIDAEMGFNEIHGRILDIDKMQGETEFESNFHLLTPDKIKPHRIPKIDTPEGQEYYNNLIDYHNCEVIVFDNLAMLSSFDENQGEGWKTVQDWLLSLRSRGLSSFIVHHAGKDKISYRGTSKFLDCANTAISLQSMDDSELEENKGEARKFKVEYQKSRGFTGKDAYPFEITLIGNIWKTKSIEQTLIDKVVERHHLKMNQTQTAIDLGISQSYVHKLLRKARALKIITDD